MNMSKNFFFLFIYLFFSFLFCFVKKVFPKSSLCSILDNLTHLLFICIKNLIVFCFVCVFFSLFSS